MKLPPHKTPRIACDELVTLACTAALGYPQPVEEKPFDDQTVDGSDSENDLHNHDMNGDHDHQNNDDDDDDASM